MECDVCLDAHKAITLCPTHSAAHLLLDVLLALKHQNYAGGDCWCGVGIGNPMLKDHTTLCKMAQAVVEAASSLD